jgi:predicted metalloprotease with PDZ domain
MPCRKSRRLVTARGKCLRGDKKRKNADTRLQPRMISGIMRTVPAYSNLRSRLLLSTLFAISPVALAQSPSPTEYHFSFPDAVHHVMLVNATFHAVPNQPLHLDMSRSSPGRYASFEFAANAFEERFTDGAGKVLPASKLNPRKWAVTSDDGTVHATYKLFGNKVDGTFVAVDESHAHINFPATVMWAEGFDDRPIRVTFELPQNSTWKIATQLYPTADTLTFTAPNFQYLMDSPVEVSDFVLRTFQVASLDPGGPPRTIRVVAHAQATDAEFDTYFAGVQKLVREEQAVFGEFPDYEPGYYTFLADALPWDDGDGMEHRNSTVMTGHRLSLATVAHEFFHNWNVERIRPEGLEPFDFRDVNMSGEMFLAEGFTQYYGNLSMLRTGLTSADDLSSFAGDMNYVLNTPGSSYRSAMDMSRLAPLVDGSANDFPKYWNNTFVSYYSFGDVLALGLDLTLRARSDSRITLDDFMRAMWLTYGKPGGPAPGLVGKPYTIADVQTQLANISHDPAFAANFVKHYIAGTEKLDYASLLSRAGFVLRRKSAPPSLGLQLVKGEHGLRVEKPTQIGSPAYNAGIDVGDEVYFVAGVSIASPDDLTKLMAGRKPGDRVEIVYSRHGREQRATVVSAESTEMELVPVETTGATITPEQKQFRQGWLGSKAH